MPVPIPDFTTPGGRDRATRRLGRQPCRSVLDLERALWSAWNTRAARASVTARTMPLTATRRPVAG